jgi:hypothetical protein
LADSYARAGTAEGGGINAKEELRSLQKFRQEAFSRILGFESCKAS